MVVIHHDTNHRISLRCEIHTTRVLEAHHLLVRAGIQNESNPGFHFLLQAISVVLP